MKPPKQPLGLCFPKVSLLTVQSWECQNYYKLILSPTAPFSEMRKSISGSKNWHVKVGGKSPGEEVGLAGPGQRTEVLGSRAEALLVGRWVGWAAQGGAPPRPSELPREHIQQWEQGVGEAPLLWKAQSNVEAGLPSESGVRWWKMLPWEGGVGTEHSFTTTCITGRAGEANSFLKTQN